MLYLLPNFLSPDQNPDEVFVPAVSKTVASLEALIAESEKEGDKFCKYFDNKLPVYLLNEHSTESELKDLLHLVSKKSVGLISDCGLPCIADPGASLVHLAREKNIRIHPFIGPSSIILSLQLSGFSGQCFSFMGYLPRNTQELEKSLKQLEKRSYSEKMTIIFIETPYRTKKIIDTCKSTLRGTTHFCMAQNIGSSKQKVISMPINKWKKQEYIKEKEPTIFLFSSPW